MRPKPKAPKDKREHLAAHTVGQLREVLSKLPSDCRVYVSINTTGDITVWKGKKVFAEIELTGY